MQEQTSTSLTTMLPTMADVAGYVDELAMSKVLRDYRWRQSEETKRRHKADLESFATYLDRAGIAHSDFYHDLEAWRGISIGLVDFDYTVRWDDGE